MINKLLIVFVLLLLNSCTFKAFDAKNSTIKWYIKNMIPEKTIK